MIDRQDSTKESVLHRAFLGGQLDLLEYLLAQGADTTLRGALGFTPLHYAACYGHGGLTRALSDTRVNANTTNDEAETALHIAARNGHIEFLRELVNECPGVNLDLLNNRMQNALAVAAVAGHSDITTFLLERGSKSLPNDDGNFPIHHAAWYGFEPIVAQLRFREGALDRGYLGQTALWNAACQGHLGIVKLLLDAGAPVDIANNDGVSPIICALIHDHSEVANFLLDHGANYTVVDMFGSTLPHIAARRGDVQTVKRLLDCQCEWLAQDVRGYTPFMRAVEADSLEIVELMLASGHSGVKIPSKLHVTCFQMAARQGNLKMLISLKGAGAESRSQDLTGRNAMFQAAARGLWEVIVYLLQEGVDLDCPDLGGRTPLAEAAWGGYPNFVDRLLRLGADVNAVHRWDRNTPLIEAADGNAPITFQKLLDAGGDPYHRNALGLNALDISSRQPHMFQIVLDAGLMHQPIDLAVRKRYLRWRIQECIKILLSNSNNLSIEGQYERIVYIRMLAYSLIEVEDDMLHRNAIPCFAESLWAPEEALVCSEYNCKICSATRFPGDKYVCVSCYTKPVLCRSCHSAYQMGGNKGKGAPESLVVLLKLEK